MDCASFALNKMSSENPATEPTLPIDDSESDTSSCVSNESDAWNQEYCVLCRKVKHTFRILLPTNKGKECPHLCALCSLSPMQLSHLRGETSRM